MARMFELEDGTEVPRSDGESYQEMLDREVNPVPAALRESQRFPGRRAQVPPLRLFLTNAAPMAQGRWFPDPLRMAPRTPTHSTQPPAHHRCPLSPKRTDTDPTPNPPNLNQDY